MTKKESAAAKADQPSQAEPESVPSLDLDLTTEDILRYQPKKTLFKNRKQKETEQ